MTKLAWDLVGKRFYETGVDHGVLYIPNGSGNYVNGYAWNGLTAITESPTGAESNPQYADNIKYLNLVSVEEFGGTIEALYYPDEFGQCDGTAEPQEGILVGQQSRKTFGLSYRTRLGNDVAGDDYGYKLHLVYGALAAPSEKAYSTVNDSPEAAAFSWEFTTTAVFAGSNLKPTSSLTINSTRVNSAKLAELEDLLYGTTGTDPSLPLPPAVLALFSGSTLEATPTVPTYNSTTKVITIPTVTGVVYTINGEPVTGDVTITADTLVTAYPASGYKFPVPTDNDWLYDF